MSARALESRISASLLRLRARAPFFGVLALFARFRATAEVPTAATDGIHVLYNPEWLGGLASAELDGVILHEVLHAALLHVTRRQERDPVRWNLAADVVVNGMIASLNWLRLPEDAVREPQLEKRTVEEIYALLSTRPLKVCLHCLQPGANGGALETHRLQETEAHWREALRQAGMSARSAQHGSLPAELERLLAEATQPRVDWRTRLWRFLVRTPVDFSGYDRRFIGQRLYLEAMEGESLEVRICLDTSGSINDELLASFLNEVFGILRAYPHIQATLYYADAALYGPYPLSQDLSRFPKPKGGGGTSFVPFFKAVAREEGAFHSQTVCLYLTDGYGTFPAEVPPVPVLWVVPPGASPPESFPFGEVVCLL